MKFFQNFTNTKFIGNQYLRRFILLILDQFIIYFSFYLVDSTKIINQYSGKLSLNLESIFTIAFSSIFYLLLTGHYKSITRYISSKVIYLIAFRNIFYVLLINSFFLILYSPKLSLNTKEIIVLWFLMTSLLTILRIFLRDFILNLNIESNDQISNVAIYGAGSAGAQLSYSLRFSNKYSLKCFFDNDKNLWSRNLNGVPIYSTKKIPDFLSDLDLIVLAIPSLNRKKRKEIIEEIENYKIKILEMPSIEDLKSGVVKVDMLKPVEIEDLLFRESILNSYEIKQSKLRNKVVCVTGAGGSIGSQLCKEIMKLKPKLLIACDMNELNLYNLEQDLINFNNSKNLICKLTSLNNYQEVYEIFKEYKVKIVFHAAAYKHVPMVEKNPIPSLFNNIFSAKLIADVSRELAVENIVLISSDKAVRPTNIMGASKRIAELIFQANASKLIPYSKNKNKSSIFSIVRFGNVLGSSGSVIPLFKSQILKGGPVTVTHRDITRYFMTIPEAVELVIKSFELAEGGDLFLLDMGKPIKVYDLAQRIIRLSGFSIKDNLNPKGDIEIKISGLREGEKLYEELLVDSKALKTKHPLIFKAKEKFIKYEYLYEKIDLLVASLSANNKDLSLELVKELVPEWSHQNK